MKRIAVVLPAILLGACSLAPKYEKPAVPVADTYKETASWQPATPNDALSRGDWWTGFRDAKLDELEASAEEANPDLAAAADHYAGARAFADEARAGLFPQIDGQALATHNRQSDTRPLRSASQPDEYKDDLVGAQLNYELDLWGRVRNSVVTGAANAQASAADLASVRLSLQAELADDYIALRGLDAQSKLLADTVDAYSKALALTKNRFKGGIASGLDVSHAQTQLDVAHAQASDVRARRALYEHAIARLVGASASSFSIEPAVVDFPLLDVPVGVPSTLLERRADIAAAERRAAAANAQIGVARAAFFPSLTLTANGGYESTGAIDWLTAPNTFWSIGPKAFLTLFDAGKRHAREREAQAQFDEAGEHYRATALTAFQQVEDNLALLKVLGDEAADENAAVVSSQKTLDLALDRYRNGAVNYLEVVESQTSALQSRRTALTLHDRQLEASVGLVRALGGGWNGDMNAPSAPSEIKATARTR
ncbi:MAG TPA: efflux transporter outer membrane subunit [Rudaea sp.]|nr:efflux transporter outer membrane subunit [Rudaea sp.]